MSKEKIQEELNQHPLVERMEQFYDDSGFGAQLDLGLWTIQTSVRIYGLSDAEKQKSINRVDTTATPKTGSQTLAGVKLLLSEMENFELFVHRAAMRAIEL